MTDNPAMYWSREQVNRVFDEYWLQCINPHPPVFKVMNSGDRKGWTYEWASEDLKTDLLIVKNEKGEIQPPPTWKGPG